MTRHCTIQVNILAITILVIGLGCSQRQSQEDNKPPNFIIIFTDDQGYQDLGVFGSPDIKTPNLDRMAKEGMKLTSFYAQTVCGPSRAALMTGSYPMRTTRENDEAVPHPAMALSEITIAEVLKTKGYQSATIGKWDLAGRQFKMELRPENQGFDYTFWTPAGNPRGYVDLYEGKTLIQEKVDNAKLTEWYTDKAIDFITEHNDQPFFLYLAHTMPHIQLATSEQFKGKSEGGLYGDVIEEIDYHTGRLLAHVKNLGLDENTYVIFTSDNGPWWIKGEDAGHCAPLRGAKTSTYEGGLRVPCIIRAPGKVPAGTTSDLVTSTMDLLPTFARLSGAALPDDRVLDGHDITEVIHGNQMTLNRTFFYYQHTALRAVREGDWKLFIPCSEADKAGIGLRWYQHVAPQDRPFIEETTLYNLKEDIGETTNVAMDHPEVVTKLMEQITFIKEDLGYHQVVGKNSRRIIVNNLSK